MMIRKFLLMTLWAVWLPYAVLAQNSGNGIITGRVIDIQAGTPVEYANIILLDTATAKLVAGVVSDSSGLFRMNNVPMGTFFLEYSFIGYVRQRTKAITLTRKNPRLNLGDLPIAYSAVTMGEVNVTAERTTMITKIDRKVFNVEKDIMAQTGTVTDVLQTIPSVSVDMDGNVSLRGSENVTILINGRPSLMSGAANLEQMPASMIERIEVITNPSAKYRPDGTAGIINIILKKDRKAGINSTLGANFGDYGRFNTNLQLNYNSGKVNLYGSYGYRQDHRIRTSSLTSQTIDTATGNSTWLIQNSSGTMKPHFHLAQLGADWNVSSKDVVGISATYSYRVFNRSDVSANTYKDSALVPTEIFNRTLDGRENENGYGVKGYYEHTFNKEDEHLVKIDFEYQDDTEKEDDYWTNDYTLPAYPQSKDHSLATNRDQEINISVNYQRPLWENASLEAGYEGNIPLTTRDQQVWHQYADSAVWIEDTEQRNMFYANQAVHALYATVSWQWKKFSVLGGLRAEDAPTYLEFKTIDTTVNQNYFALYPTLHMGITSGKNEWQLNYSRRVNRPDGEDMNPVPEYRDPRNIFVGNPELKPEDIHSIEFGYSFKHEGLTVVPSLFYRYKVNGFSWVTHTENDTILVTTIENIATDQSAGLDLSGTWQIRKIAGINFGASGFYNEIDASNIGYSSHKAAWSWNAKVNASFSITKTTFFQFNGQYRSEVLTPQGFRRPTWVINLGFRQDFWKKKVSLIATISDLFNSQVWKTSINTPELVSESMRKRDARVFYVGFLINVGTSAKKSKEPKFEFDNGMDR